MNEYRYLLSCTLSTPARIGTGAANLFTDATLRRSAAGRPVVPGTGLAGALRAIAERVAPDDPPCRIATGPARRASTPCPCLVCELFGNVRPTGETARASRVTVLDAPLTRARTRIIDGVSLDRDRGSAADRLRFDAEELLPGASFQIELRARDLDEEQSALLETVLATAKDQGLILGARAAAGMGRVTLDAIERRGRDLSNIEHLVAAARHPSRHFSAWPQGAGAGPRTHQPLPAPAVVAFTLTSPAHSTFLVADPTEATRAGRDRAPRGGPTTPELPGSSLRGALRSAAERILRTLGTGAACTARTRKGRCGLHRGRCLACELFGDVSAASPLRVVVETPDRHRASPAPFDHVALDRFTGGARDALKFDALAARGASFQVTLELRAKQARRPWMAGLLLLALADLHHGLATVGHGGAKGHGWMRVDGRPRIDGIDAGHQQCVDALWKRLGPASARQQEETQ